MSNPHAPPADTTSEAASAPTDRASSTPAKGGSVARVQPRRPARTALIVAIVLAGVVGAMLAWRRHTRFPPDTTVEGAYARVVLAVTEARPRDAFAYLETQAQWACFTIRKYRADAYAMVEGSYPEPERSKLLATYRPFATAADGPDVFVAFASEHGLIARLRHDLSGIRSIVYDGRERATIETARGSRYNFRRRENGIWGLTLFTAELVAEAEKAARDDEVVRAAASDYRAAAAAGSSLTPSPQPPSP